MKITFILLASLLMIGCGNKAQQLQPDANYMQEVNAFNQSNMAKAQMFESLTKGCMQDKEDSAWCINSLAWSMNSGGGNNTKVPQFRPQPTKGDIILSKGLDILGAAVPVFGNYAISKDNNRANVRINESRNAMLSEIVTGGFDGMTTLGSRDSVVVGGDYIIGNENGDGNRYGDGNVVGDGNMLTGDDSIIGDSNTQGDGNLFSEGTDNIIGDANRDIDGSGNAIDNDIGEDLIIGDGNETDNDNSDNSDNSEGGGG